MADGAAQVALSLMDRGDRALERLSLAVGDASRTVRFMRGRTAFAPRPADVFVASYPRSGTTWTQAIVYLLLSGQDGFGFSHIADVSPWWERSLAWRRDAAAEFDRLPSPRVFKTHLPHRWLPSGARTLYVWRNPEDVALSYYHLYRRYLRFDGPFAEFFYRFLRGEVQYRSWFRHVAGWRRAADADADSRILLLPYEELSADTAGWVARIAEFLQVTVSSARVGEIVRATSLARMKADQDKFDHVGELCRQWGIRAGEFVREGRVGHGRRQLSDGQRAALDQARTRRVMWPSVEWRLPAFLH